MSAENLLYELRVVDDRGAFVATADQLVMTPLDFEPAVWVSRKVCTPFPARSVIHHQILCIFCINQPALFLPGLRWTLGLLTATLNPVV